jgi:hypothetical protein
MASQPRYALESNRRSNPAPQWSLLYTFEDGQLAAAHAEMDDCLDVPDGRHLKWRIVDLSDNSIVREADTLPEPPARTGIRKVVI